MVNFKEIYPEGVQHFTGGSNFIQGGGGSICLFPIETHITCDFPGGGGVWTPCPPLRICTCSLVKIEPVLSSLAQGHNIVTLPGMSLELATL